MAQAAHKRGPNAADVRRQVSLLSLIPSDVLKPAGHDRYKCCCLFHADKTASMVVNLHHGQWGFRCFGCGVYGGVIDFVMLRDGASFRDAVARLSTGLVDMAPLPPKPKARFELGCDGRDCVRRLEVKDVATLAFIYQKGWRLDDDGRAWCGWCLERAFRRREGLPALTAGIAPPMVRFELARAA